MERRRRVCRPRLRVVRLHRDVGLLDLLRHFPDQPVAPSSLLAIAYRRQGRERAGALGCRADRRRADRAVRSAALAHGAAMVQGLVGGLVPPAFERSTYVHMANAALFALIIFWQPIPTSFGTWVAAGLRDGPWVLSASAGSSCLRAPGRSACATSRPGPDARLAARPATAPTAAPHRFSLRLAPPSHVCGRAARRMGDADDDGRPCPPGLGLTAYVGIAMRYEERDLARRFGATYRCWRGPLR